MLLTRTTLADRLTVLFASLPARGADDFSAEVRLRAYWMALEGEIVEDLDTVIRDLIRGETKYTFAPDPPELARLVRNAGAWRKYVNAKPALPPLEPPLTTKERAERVKRLQALSRHFEAVMDTNVMGRSQ